MEESFKPLSLSVSQLFGDPKTLYKIPVYQRPYKWVDEQVEQLWDDIFEAYENNVENYFLGSIITAKPVEPNSVYIDIVDGQQRLTTLMILFCVLRDNFQDINENDTENLLTVDLEAVKAAIVLNNRAERLKLFTHAQHQTDFSKEILNEGATCIVKEIFKYDLKNEQEPLYKFRNTAAIFKEKLFNLKETVRGKFINYLFFKVQIIRIDCTNRDFAIKLFQVLNDRGMDLTSADLLKSYLIEKLYNIYKDDKELLRQYENNFISEWLEMENLIKDSDINLSELLTMYEYYLLGSNPKRSLTEEARSLFKDENPISVISDLKEFAGVYKKEIYNSELKIIHSFKYIRWSTYWKTILMTALIENYRYIDELRFELRRFYYLYWIAGKTLSQVKQASFNTIRAIKHYKHINYIRAIFNNKIKNDNIIPIVKENLKSNVTDGEVWIKPLLIMMEYEFTDSSTRNFIKLDKELHLEHILPKAYKQYDEWNYITDVVMEKWLRSAANLTLLSGQRNMEASNRPFSEKVKIYASGKANTGRMTSFRITEQIWADFNNNKFSGQWNEGALKNRWKWFFIQVEKILGIDCRDIQDEEEPTLQNNFLL